MNNLVPEKRMDKNGKLVTKHVRSGAPQKSKLGNAPAPTLTKAKPTGVKLTPKQLEERDMLFPYVHEMDSATVRFRASDAEFYDVMSKSDTVGSCIRAMVDHGCRNKGDILNVISVTEDHTLLTQEALRRRIKPEDFVSAFQWFRNYDHEVSSGPFDKTSPEGVKLILDTVEFRASPLAVGKNGMVWSDVLHDQISYDDIKNIGINKLKSYDRLHSLRAALIKMHSGEANYDADDVKRLVDREMAEKKAYTGYSTRGDDHVFNVVGEALEKKGMSFIDQAASLESISTQYDYYTLLRKDHYDQSTIWDRIEYATLIQHQQSAYATTNTADQMFEAGIPVETAAQVLAAGGGVLEAKAIHEEGISKSVAGGWL